MNFSRYRTKSIILYAFLLTVLFPPLVYSRDLRDLSIQELSGKAPDLMIRTNTKEVHLSDYRGKVVMLHFWARCSACMQEMPTLESLYRRFNNKGLVFLAITTEPKANKRDISAMAKKMGITFPIYFASEGEVLDSYWAAGEPQTYLIDKKGNFIGKAFGARDWSSKEATGLVSGLLKEN